MRREVGARPDPQDHGPVRPQIVAVDHRSAWNEYVTGHPAGTFYHRYEWLAVIERAFGHTAIPLAAVSNDRLIGVFPLVLMKSRLFGRFLISVPFVNYGGVIGDTEEVERWLWRRAIEVAKAEQAAFLEARHRHPHAFVEQRKEHKVGMVLSLAPSIEAQWKAFGSKLRNQIRKAELSGLAVRIEGATGLEAFYCVYARNMRDLGTPVYGRRFFSEVLNAFPDAGRIFTVWSGRTAVAAALALAYRDTLEVPWAASRRDARALCPNNRLYWELIQHAIKAGFTRFDFGRSTKGGGAYKFKQQWGAEEVPLVWEYWTENGHGLPELHPQNPRYALAVALWKRLPLWAANMIGPLIVRSIP